MKRDSENMKNNFQVFSEQSHLNRGTAERLVCSLLDSVSPEDLQRELSVPIGYKGVESKASTPLAVIIRSFITQSDLKNAVLYMLRVFASVSWFRRKGFRSVGIPRIRPASIQVAKLYADAAGMQSSQFTRLGKFRRSSGLLFIGVGMSSCIDGYGIGKQNV
ncbi:hypothetical protein CDAR_531941 [Caerostris darwini]|uniref:Uncharacterized protein n=1 Tax=Caerostris darwini TaxID=1538125 RepID=A0AAV4W9Y3_9ARAC|nr:hypothetical protein CDAR_531941 [Caerostris darwini]